MAREIEHLLPFFESTLRSSRSRRDARTENVRRTYYADISRTAGAGAASPPALNS
jgi:hypothetical protein